MLNLEKNWRNKKKRFSWWQTTTLRARQRTLWLSRTFKNNSKKPIISSTRSSRGPRRIRKRSCRISRLRCNIWMKIIRTSWSRSTSMTKTRSRTWIRRILPWPRKSKYFEPRMKRTPISAYSSLIFRNSKRRSERKWLSFKLSSRSVRRNLRSSLDYSVKVNKTLNCWMMSCARGTRTASCSNFRMTSLSLCKFKRNEI